MDHKKFFVKDFIQYASPCFGCEKPLSLRMLIRNKEDNALLPELGNSPSTALTPTITDKHLEIDLSIKYNSKLRLWMMHKTNTFLVNDNVAFSNYIAKYNLRLLVACTCGTLYQTNNLDFQTFNRTIGALTLSYEQLVFQDKTHTYHLDTDFRTERSIAIISKKGSTAIPLHFDLPLLPKYKLRNKQHLVEKLRIYSIFS